MASPDVSSATVSQVSLLEKIGQMLIVGFRGGTPADVGPAARDVRDHRVGGIILFDQEMTDTSRGRRNVESPEQVRELVAHLQSHARVPLLVSIDQEGGRVNRLKPVYGFPESISHQELGTIDDPAETHRHAGATARTLAGLGINLNLAPVVDLDANPDNPIIKGKGRSFSADPEKAAVHAGEFVKAHRAHGVLACSKHFPGHGSAAGDTHLGFVDVTNTWNERELVPFRRLIDAGLCDMVMSAHVFNAKLDPKVPSTLSRAVLTGLLRGKLGFKGVVASDDMEMRAISGRYGLEESVLAAVEAGVDILCFGNNMTYDPDIAGKVVSILAKGVEAGRIPAARIDESYNRILELKRKARIVA